jgi:hypothetical protein
VCRHAQNDLATTTNILVTPLAAKCIAPFTPAVFGPGGNLVTPASAECRTSELTLAEFKSLTGKMDSFDPRAKTPREFLGGVPSFRTDFQAGPTSGHLVSHKESIELLRKLGVKMTPELKAPSVTMPFNGFTQQAYEQKMIDEYKAAGVPASRVFAQSFDRNDILYWVNHEPAFGKQAVYLDDANVIAELPAFPEPVSTDRGRRGALSSSPDQLPGSCPIGERRASATNLRLERVARRTDGCARCGYVALRAHASQVEVIEAERRKRRARSSKIVGARADERR